LQWGDEAKGKLVAERRKLVLGGANRHGGWQSERCGAQGGKHALAQAGSAQAGTVHAMILRR